MLEIFWKDHHSAPKGDLELALLAITVSIGYHPRCDGQGYWRPFWAAEDGCVCPDAMAW